MAITFLSTQPKNVTMSGRFNSGTIPGTANQVNLYARYVDSNNYIKAKLAFQTGSTTITIDEVTSGAVNNRANVSSSQLATSTVFYFVLTVSERNVTAQVWTTGGVNNDKLNILVTTSGTVTVNHVMRGQIGYEYVNNGNMTVQQTRATRTEYATFISTDLPTVTPIRGAQIFPHTSPPNDLVSGATYVAWQDATLSTGSIGLPTPSTRVIRSGASSTGGLATSTSFEIGDSTVLSVVGDIYPVTAVHGTYRAALLDSGNNRIWTNDIGTLIADQWNAFNIPVVTELLPSPLTLVIEQVGTYDDEFFIDNLKVNQETVSWEASTDSGATWQRFLRVGEPLDGIKFANPDNLLKVKATAHVERAWIQGYRIKSLYGFPGQIIYSNNTMRRQDLRVTGQSSSNRTQDLRIVGA
jgi:hypothetical protein